LKGENFQNVSELHSKPLRVWTHKSWNCAHNFFCKTRGQRTSKMRLNFTANRFVFERTSCGIAPKTFSVNLAGRERPECVWISRQSASFMDAQIVELRLELFLWNLQAENFQNACEFHGKPLRFWTHKSGKCAQNFFYKAWKAKTSKMRLNFTANRFIFGRTNRGIAPTTFFVELAGRERPKCVWTSQQTALFLDAQIEKMRPELFINLARRKLPKCVWTQQQTASFLDT